MRMPGTKIVTLWAVDEGLELYPRDAYSSAVGKRFSVSTDSLEFTGELVKAVVSDTREAVDLTVLVDLTVHGAMPRY